MDRVSLHPVVSVQIARRFGKCLHPDTHPVKYLQYRRVDFCPVCNLEMEVDLVERAKNLSFCKARTQWKKDAKSTNTADLRERIRALCQATHSG
jgi:hypothetical protein